MFDMMKIGRRIAGKRREKNMTQMELSDMLGISHQAISKWERGESMPDISTLPILAGIFGMTVDDLLESAGVREIAALKSVLNDTAESAVDDGKISMSDISEIVPLLKPSQLDGIAEQCRSISIEDLCSIAPFLSPAVLDRLAEKVAEVNGIGVLCSIAPFISREMIDKLAERAANIAGINELCGIAPFVSRELLDRLAEKAAVTGSINDLLGIAPFISREILDKLALSTAVFDQ